MAASSKQTAEVVGIILLFFSYSLFQNISYAKGTIELHVYQKDVRGMHLVIYLSIKEYIRVPIRWVGRF